MLESLNVSWEMPAPPLKPNSWHVWESAPWTSIGRDIEEELGWPPGVIDILHQAFEMKLTRTDGWDLGRIPENKRRAYAISAECYKRGVGFRPNQSHRTLKGQYTIDLVDTDPLGACEVDAFILCDAKVAKHWPALASRSPFVLAVDEQSKTLATISKILKRWRQTNRPKHWWIVGGGVLTDTAAYAAALAGAHCFFVPTTLLAMADACVGGKTGINFPPYGKNQVGAFYFPKKVVIWNDWLKTLPKRQLKAGAIECIKHGILSGDATLAESIQKAVIENRLTQLTKFLPKVITVKTQIVAADPHEGGCRASLNLGHTLAHALEAISHSAVSGDDLLLHGEAVGIGLGFAAFLSERLTGLPSSSGQWIRALLKPLLPDDQTINKSLGCPLSSPRLKSEIVKLIGQDKKSIAKDQWNFVLLDQHGRVSAGDSCWTTPVDRESLDEVWPQFCRWVEDV